MASDLLWQARSGRHELNHRSYSHSFTVLYLYREGGPMPKAIRHSVSGKALAPGIGWPGLSTCAVSHVCLPAIPCSHSP